MTLAPGMKVLLVRIAGCHPLLVTCALVLLASACADGDAERGRVLLVGIDGASLRVARPLLQAGKLPNLERIARRGVYGPLRSHPPMMSPRIWTSIATGMLPDHHGIRGFAKEDDAGHQRLYLSSDRTVPALWNIASEAGLRVAVVNWWATYPVERVDGVMVSDHLVAGEIQGRRDLTGAEDAAAGPLVHPRAWRARVEALAQVDERLTAFDDPFADADALPRWAAAEQLSRRFREDERVVRIALAIDEAERPDLLMVFLPGIDRVSHRLWGALEPPSRYPRALFTPSQRSAAVTALHAYYRFTDALIGLLVARFGPDDLVLVVSDHGFEAGGGLGFLTGGHETAASLDGVVFARGRHIAAPAQPHVVSVNDVTPTILAWLALPVGRDMDGQPASFLDLPRESIARIDSYADMVVERPAAGPSGAEQRMLENLRALGYLEGGEAP
jgi:predicted AlkP superfamily phosphohydrolase/phosphomutase